MQKTKADVPPTGSAEVTELLRNYTKFYEDLEKQLKLLASQPVQIAQAILAQRTRLIADRDLGRTHRAVYSVRQTMSHVLTGLESHLLQAAARYRFSVEEMREMLLAWWLVSVEIFLTPEGLKVPSLDRPSLKVPSLPGMLCRDFPAEVLAAIPPLPFGLRLCCASYLLLNGHEAPFLREELDRVISLNWEIAFLELPKDYNDPELILRFLARVAELPRPSRGHFCPGLLLSRLSQNEEVVKKYGERLWILLRAERRQWKGDKNTEWIEVEAIVGSLASFEAFAVVLARHYLDTEDRELLVRCLREVQRVAGNSPDRYCKIRRQFVPTLLCRIKEYGPLVPGDAIHALLQLSSENNWKELFELADPLNLADRQLRQRIRYHVAQWRSMDPTLLLEATLKDEESPTYDVWVIATRLGLLGFRALEAIALRENSIGIRARTIVSAFPTLGCLEGGSICPDSIRAAYNLSRE